MIRLLAIPIVALLALATAAPRPGVVHPLPGAQPLAAAWSWPLHPGPDRIVRDFDPPAKPWLAGNRGLDLLGSPGEAVYAAGDGVVSFAGQINHIGVVSVTSGALRTTYEPLRVLVRAGQQVTRRTVLGRLMPTGSHCPPDACLHWGLLRGTLYLDPLALLGLERVRLLPFEG